MDKLKKDVGKKSEILEIKEELICDEIQYTLIDNINNINKQKLKYFINNINKIILQNSNWISW